VRSAVISGRTSLPERDGALLKLEAGELDVVVNVGVLTEGFDAPHVSCIVLARPCAHDSTYIQIVGRMLRAAPGKAEATLIDLVGASHRHGLPGQNREHTLLPAEPPQEPRAG
jgi:superfamily II DNA or RNA helicase